MTSPRTEDIKRIGRLLQLASMCALLTLPLLSPPTAHSQTCIRIMAKDSTLNNLVDPPGYRTGRLGELGEFKKVGAGPQPMILIPGLGFGGSIFDELTDGWKDKYSMYAVTLPGFDGTAAPQSPSESTSFGEQTWTNGALAAIEKLIRDENIQNPILVGHWLTGTQLALRLALKNPDNVRAVIILSGSTRMLFTDTSWNKYVETPEKRIASIDNFSAPRWFKTVTRETWDDNNFLPGDYAVNPVRGLRLWREAAEPRLHVWVRYLCEFNAQDVSVELSKLAVPTLILKPGLEGNFHEPGQNYMELYCHKGWEGLVENNPKITVRTIPNSRVCLWFDQPEQVNDAIGEFLAGVK